MELSDYRSFCLKFSICLAFLFWGLMIALQPPFYPSEAEKKGAKPTEYGSVFGAFYLGAFIFSPISGQIGRKIGPKVLCISGAMIQAICTVIFGFLEDVNDKDEFIGFSIALRFLSGIAEAGSWNAGMTILRATYPNIKNTMMAWTEMAFGIGACFGPPLGSLLYEIGGFSLPFWMVGSLALVQTLTLFYAIPHWNFTQISTVSKMPLTLKDVLSFWILVPYWDLFVTYLGYGLINSMLEEYMYKETGANEFQIGGTFTGLGLVYMVFSLSSGYPCDRMSNPGILSVLSNVNLIISFIFIGPISILNNVKPTWISIGVCTTFMGISFGSVMVTSMGRVQKTVTRMGFDQDWKTDLILCGIWSTVFYFSNFIGPSIAGTLVQHFGFRTTTSIFPIIYVINLLINSIEFLMFRNRTEYAIL